MTPARMNTAVESRDTNSRTARVLMRIFLVCCGIALFAVAGVAGALITLYWLI